MQTQNPVIELNNLTRRYGKLEAVNGLSLTVQPGRCYGFFGRNGAGKTTTIKCLLNLLQPSSGSVRVFGLEPQRHEVEVKSRLCYVPDMVAFYPWMTVSQTLEFLASFRPHWNRDIEADLLKRFQLDPAQKTSHLSRGQRTQLALIGAVCPEPELLVLDEPTSWLDPIVQHQQLRSCWCWTNRPRGWTQSSAASSSRRSSGPTTPAIRSTGRSLFPLTSYRSSRD